MNIKRFTHLSLALLFLSPCTITQTAGSMNKRVPSNTIADIFLNRWSPRAMSGDSVSDKELMALFEAARWAPSSYNGQPWRFIYAKRGTPAWDTLFNLLVDFNKSWAKNAGALVVIVSKNNFDHNNEPSRTHSFDTGAAWQNLALQGSLNGLVVHGMSGFYYERAAKDLHIPQDYTVEAMAAIGKPGSVNDLPEAMRSSEHPSGRNALETMVFEGTFKQ